MFKANQDIRDYMADHGVTQTMVAKFMGVSGYTVCMKLKKELSQKEKEDWLNIIDAIAADNNEEPANEETPDEVIEETTEETEEVDVEETEIEEAETEEPEETTDVTVTTKFQIGDRVKIPSKTLRIGIVSDIWHSILQNKLMYAVDIEGGTRGLYAETQLEPAPIPIEYTFNTTCEDNVAVVCMIARQGDKTWVHARGHAHILHDGDVGMAQAVSYAAKRMFEALDTAQDKQIYFKNNR